MDTSTLITEDSIRGEDSEETVELRQMLKNAKLYISSFDWCPDIDKVFLGFGIGGVIAVFLFRFVQPIGEEKDDVLWVIEGDLPSAYLVTDDAPTPRAALQIYCELMEDWVAAVKTGSSLETVFPVRAKADNENAIMLERRISFIRNKILPYYFE